MTSNRVWNELMYLLDTNVCIVFLKGKNDSLRQQIDEVPSNQI
ncbi:MAG TPA: hypothetical protein VM260_13280 [Pirellula sp.]|nr:hypothetical protein [Pirellula sp.]